jgi:hypothetical protein
MMLWIEGAVALAIALAFLAYAILALKPQYVAHHPTRVRIGATIQGLTLGLLIGFVMVPLRLQVMHMSGSVQAPGGLSYLSYIPAFVLYIIVRRGALLKAPVLSLYMRAYRRAMLLKQLDDAQSNLSKLDQIEAKFA